jgi:hypothetical protein
VSWCGERSAIRLALCTTRRPGKLHTVVDHAQDLNNAVRRDAIDEQMPWPFNSMLQWHKTAD